MNAAENLMKALVVTDEKRVAIQEVPRPEPLPGEVLIKIDTCLICTWEQRIFSGGSGTTLPFVPGHESSGTIERVPDDTVTSFKVGDKVVFKTLDHCGHCSYCYQGQTNQCTGISRKRSYGGILGSGGMAEYIALDVSKVFPVGEDIDLITAAFAEPIACCLHSVERVRLHFGDTVAVIGAGIMGQLHSILARLRGCRIIVIEPDQVRRELALKLGAHEGIDPSGTDPVKRVRDITGGEGVEAVFSTVTKSAVAASAVGMLRKMGSLVLYGSFHPNEPMPIDPNAVHYKEYVITGSYSPSTRDFFRATRLLSLGLLNPSPFISAIYPIAKAEEAFMASLRPDTYRVVIRIDSNSGRSL
jgi:L-iditol 2-dehydrogenase